MALATYANLKTAVATWLSRADQTTNIPDFIALAHAKLMRTLRVREMETTDSLTIDSETENVPTLWLETRSLYIVSGGVRIPLSYMAPEKMIDLNPAGTSGAPRYFTVVGGAFRFSPIPDASYTGTHTYYKGLAAMSGDSDTNWILTSHSDLYLYGALLEASMLIQDDPRVPLWQAAYREAVLTLIMQSARAKSGPGMMVKAG
jgi:hypothetical protein